MKRDKEKNDISAPPPPAFYIDDYIDTSKVSPEKKDAVASMLFNVLTDNDIRENLDKVSQRLHQNHKTRITITTNDDLPTMYNVRKGILNINFEDAKNYGICDTATGKIGPIMLDVEIAHELAGHGSDEKFYKAFEKVTDILSPLKELRQRLGKKNIDLVSYNFEKNAMAVEDLYSSRFGVPPRQDNYPFIVKLDKPLREAQYFKSESDSYSNYTGLIDQKISVKDIDDSIRSFSKAKNIYDHKSIELWVDKLTSYKNGLLAQGQQRSPDSDCVVENMPLIEQRTLKLQLSQQQKILNDYTLGQAAIPLANANIVASDAHETSAPVAIAQMTCAIQKKIP